MLFFNVIFRQMFRTKHVYYSQINLLWHLFQDENVFVSDIRSLNVCYGSLNFNCSLMSLFISCPIRKIKRRGVSNICESFFEYIIAFILSQLVIVIRIDFTLEFIVGKRRIFLHLHNEIQLVVVYDHVKIQDGTYVLKINISCIP